MVDTSYENFKRLRRALKTNEEKEATRDHWEGHLNEERRRVIIANLSGRLNGRNTVIYPKDKPETQEVAW